MPESAHDFFRALNQELTLVQKNLWTKAVSEGGETGSRGHLSVEVARRPRPYGTSPRGDCGVALEAVSYCPRV